MSYRIELNGNKEDAKKAIEEQSDSNIKAQTQTAEQKAGMLKFLDALPDGNLSGAIEDHNNGTVTINVTVRQDVYEQARAATVSAKTPVAVPPAAAKSPPNQSQV